MMKQLVQLLWKDVYVRRFRRHFPSTLTQALLALVVIYTVRNDVSNKAALDIRQESQRQAADVDDVPVVPRPLRPGSSPGSTMTSAPQRTPAIMPPVVFPASHPLDGWNAGKNGSEFCFVAPRSFLEPIAHRAAEILNATKVTSLSSMQEVTRHFAKALQSPDKPGPGSLVAVIFNTTLLEMEEKTQKKKVISPLAEGPWVLDYQVRVNGINFDVNVHYRRFLLLPSALVLDSFGEMTHLLPIQYAVDTAYIEAVSAALERPLDYEVTLRRFPYPSLYPEDFPTTYARVAFRFVVAFWLPFIFLVMQIVDERSSGMRELERMFGVSNANYWLSHFLSMETWVAMVGAFALLVLYGEQADERGESTAIIALTNPALVYLVLLCFGALLAVDAMLVSLFFSSTLLAGLIASVYWFLSLLLGYVFIQNPYSSGYYLIKGHSKLITSGSPGLFLHWCWMVFERLERFAGGGGFKNFASADLTPDNVTIFQLIARALSSCAYTMILIWYIDNVTTCHGTKIAQPYHFLFKRTYWRPPIIVGTPPVATNTTSRHYEPEKEDAKPIMSISNVSKKYEDEPILNNVSLNIFSKQITVLLAPAGSAKTTLMKLITGWSAPDSGTITIGQYDVAQNTEAARRLIGYSPDDPVLFSDLTVEEHLVFFAMVRPSGKSLTNETVRKDASRAIRDMGLTRYRNRCVEDLKAGYRRLLGVTIAMMPFSEIKILVLDDPTRHMDPRSRREMWEVLFKVRRYKGVFITTSDYAEAEALADRIAVLVKGQFYCVGSPEYIKGQFGMGYQLRLHKGSDYKADDVESLIQKKHTFPPPRKALDNKGAVVFRLTGDSDKLSITMREIFFALELEKSRLGIDKMGVTVTTLEDVLESVSERRSVPASMPGSHEASAINEPPVVKKGHVAAKGNKAEKIASKMDNDAKPMQDEQIKQDAFANDRLGLLRKQSQAAVGIVATINCLFQKRVMDWTRTVTLRSGRWLLPSALLLLGGYCESLALSGTTTLRTTLTYDMANIVGQAAGFCGATKNGRFQSFVVNFVCPLMQASDIHLEELDVTNAQSQLLDLADEDVSTYVFRYQMGVVSTHPEPRITLWFNGQNPHAALLALNLLHTAILKNLTRNPIATIQLTNAPDTFEGAHTPDTLLSFLRELELSSTRRKSTDYVVHVAIVRLFCAVFVPAALCYHGAHFVALVLGERMSGAKHLQLMTGLSSSVYWLGHFTFDMCLCVVHAAAMAGATALFRPYLSWNFVFAIYMMFITYGGCATCLAYLASFWFENVTKAFYTMVNIYMFGGVIGSLVAAAADMYVFVASSEATYLWLELLLTIPIRWLPTYIVTRGLTKLILLRKEALLCSEGGVLLERYCHEDFLRYTHSLQSCCPQSGYTNSPETPAKLRPLGLSLYSGLFELFALLLEACFCFFAASFLDSDLAQRLWVRYQIRDVHYDPQNQDSINEDVRNEAVLVDKIFNQAKFAEHALVVRNLSKAYGFFQQHFAIETISFTVHHGECIGIVGVIGTGKTSMMGVLGGELFPTSGDAFRPGMSLTRDYRFWIQSVGYVPFGWGLLETLTGREMIRVIALLRGVQDVPRTTARVMGVVELSEPDAVVSTYSVGAKTQLSLALALIAAPKLYLLDLPELDTQSRAIVHRVLGLLRPSSTVVLTCEHLHHYEDVCDRLAIMVAGRIECIGSVKGLSDKYVRGTTVTIYTFPDRKYDMDHQSAIVVDMTEHFSTSSLARCYEGVLEFRLPDTPMGLCEMFDRLLFLKRKHKFHVFYVSETTLDQIFLSLCRKHAAIAHQSPL